MTSRQSNFFRPATFIILTFFLLTFFDCSVFVPTIYTVMPKIIDILTHNGKSDSCEVCGAVLESIDIVQHLSSRSVDRCAAICGPSCANSENWDFTGLRPPLGPSFKDSNRVLSLEMYRYCQNILDWTLNVFEVNNNKNNAVRSFIWENQYFLCHYIATNVDLTNSGYKTGFSEEQIQGKSVPSSNGTGKHISFRYPIPSQVGKSALSLPLYTHTWFLRHPMNKLHHRYCYDFCEATLNPKERVLLVLWRQMVIYNLHHFLYACRHVYPWFVRTTAILAFLFAQALGSYDSVNVYRSKSKDWDPSQPGLKDNSSRIERNGILMKGSNILDHANGNQGVGGNFASSLDAYYSTRSGQNSKRKKK